MPNAEAMVPSRLCGAAEDDHQERVDDVERAAGGPVEPMVVNAAPAMPARPQPSAKVSAVDSAGVDAGGARPSRGSAWWRAPARPSGA